ncbi:type VII secretion integral membrane protein EccD [Rhizocola hellebori]|uniref:Type VII secretion integral membrane protein EccD n=1 Tax=Rhizocola hellebori TaxID=1392758 RepID=A0A8J3QCX0_9ACTN|nr:type VII secretion integral membrane protein EccD [Rhizocola hellebori]GIH08325.1 type VII secretion integral membrane protein EccD [Rhizocola hellebori]
MTHPATTITSSSGLTRVTLHTPQRRVDVALPAMVALAELLPELLRHAGIGLADDGEQHGGWIARRADGTTLDEAKSLQQLGVRDGEVLHLVPAREQWPELEYDDVVEAIAAGSRRRGAAWTPNATRVSTLAGAAILLLAGVMSLLKGGPTWAPGGYLALTVAVLLLVGGVLASRAYGDGIAGSALAGFALPYAFAGGALLLGGAAQSGVVPSVLWLGSSQLLVGCVAMLLFAALGAAGVGHGMRIFMAGGLVGLLGAISALLAGLGAAGAAAIVIAALVCGIGLLPVLAIRFGKVPVPSITLPRDAESFGAISSGGRGRATGEIADRSRVFAAVSRSEELLTGMLLGYTVLASFAALILAVAGGTAGRVLVAVGATALLLRSRLFVTIRQRGPLIAAGLLGHIMLLGGLVFTANGSTRAFFAVGAVVLALIVVLAGQTWSRTTPSPYVGRAADIFDLLIVVSVVPVAGWVLGIYAAIQSWTA